jgi:tetratricopeptide (TPR) repeat protein
MMLDNSAFCRAPFIHEAMRMWRIVINFKLVISLTMIQKTFPAFFLSLLISSLTFAQKIDSLNAVLDTAKNDRKVKTLNELFRANLSTDPVKALGYTREALNLATEISDNKGMAASYNNLGIIYRNQGALDKALDYYLTSLKIYEGLKNKEGIATTKNNISNIYSIKKDFTEALKFLEESYTLFIELNDQSKIVGSLNNLGNLNIETQQYDKAMQYFVEASKLSETIGVKFPDPLNNIGNIYYMQGNYQRAVEFYEKALVMERENNNKLGILNVVANLGITYAKARQPKPAKVYLDEAIALCSELQAYSFLPSIYKGLAGNAANQNSWKEAYDMELKYDDAREKIYGEESTKNIAQMEMVIDFQEKEKEYDILRKQSEIDKLELRNSRLFIILVIIAVLSILGGLNFYYINKKKSLKIKKELAKRKKE